MKTTENEFGTIKVRKSHLPKMKRIAALEGRSMQDLIDQAFSDYIKRYEAAVGREITDLNVRELVERIEAKAAGRAHSPGRASAPAPRKKTR